MICKPCSDAGDLWGMIKDAPLPTVEETIEAMIAGTFRGKVKELHDQCKGGTWCDCQHQQDRVVVIVNG